MFKGCTQSHCSYCADGGEELAKKGYRKRELINHLFEEHFEEPREKWRFIPVA